MSAQPPPRLRSVPALQEGEDLTSYDDDHARYDYTSRRQKRFTHHLWLMLPPPRLAMLALTVVAVKAVMKIAVSTLRASVTASVMKLMKYMYAHMPSGEAYT